MEAVVDAYGASDHAMGWPMARVALLVDFRMQKRKLENCELRPGNETRVLRPENGN
jgi:hypothetical protein